MNKSIGPRIPVTPDVDHTVPLFRAYLIVTAGVAVMFGLSWREPRGLGALIQGMLLSFILLASGTALLLAVRARELMTPASIRPWMRPTAMAIVICGVAVTGSTFWRWYA